MNTRLLKKQTNIAEKVGISKLEFKYHDEKNGAVNRGMNGVNNVSSGMRIRAITALGLAPPTC